jgi:hypothetical protein
VSKDLTAREIQFYNLFWIFTICGVRIGDIELLWLRFGLGMSYRDLARRYNCTYQNVEAKVRRCVKIIKKSPKLSLFIDSV